MIMRLLIIQLITTKSIDINSKSSTNNIPDNTFLGFSIYTRLSVLICNNRILLKLLITKSNTPTNNAPAGRVRAEP